MPRGGARVGAGRPKGSGKKSGAAIASPVKAASTRFKPAATPKPSPKQDHAAEPDLPETPVLPETLADTPLEYMLSVMKNPLADPNRRDRMAVAAAAYMHTKKGEGGKKEGQRGAAKAAGAGKFAPASAPRLVSSR